MEYNIILSQDIHSLSEFRAQASAVIAKVKDSGRIAVITQNGKGAAVLMNIKQFEELSALKESVINEPEIAYEAISMDKKLYQKIENLSKEEQTRLEHLVDTLIAPVTPTGKLPALDLGGKLDNQHIRTLAHE